MVVVSRQSNFIMHKQIKVCACSMEEWKEDGATREQTRAACRAEPAEQAQAKMRACCVRARREIEVRA